MNLIAPRAGSGRQYMHMRRSCSVLYVVGINKKTAESAIIGVTGRIFEPSACQSDPKSINCGKLQQEHGMSLLQYFLYIRICSRSFCRCLFEDHINFYGSLCHRLFVSLGLCASLIIEVLTYLSALFVKLYAISSASTL
jgi:hypothetical protein